MKGLEFGEASKLAAELSVEHGAAHVHLDADSTYSVSTDPLGIRFSESHVDTYADGRCLGLDDDLRPFMDERTRRLSS